ncbi:protein SSX1-like [Artibeus jamaicensis]|uniref:protein SSX1-like n=1 Tax=Artibeus jamaicensis TaxID=9417 RepID=UPI00235A7463|nr:protein SSX1-like [Artibeus jamaicensis]
MVSPQCFLPHRTFGLATGETQAVSLQGQIIPTAMNTSSSSAEKPKEGKVKSEEKCKAFMDICKYFSKEQWAKLGNSEKITYVYMKRNYDTMTRLGLRAHLPDFMHPNKQTTKSPEHDSDEDQNPENQGLGKEKTNVWLHRLRKRRNHVAYEETSDPEEDDCVTDLSFQSPPVQNSSDETDLLPAPKHPCVPQATQDSQEEEDPYVGHGIGRPQDATVHDSIAEVEHCLLWVF